MLFIDVIHMHMSDLLMVLSNRIKGIGDGLVSTRLIWLHSVDIFFPHRLVKTIDL